MNGTGRNIQKNEKYKNVSGTYPEQLQGNISYAKKYIKLDDNDHFNLTSEGNLEFKYYPDFENPSDKDKNNTYYVAVYAEGYEDPNDIVIQPINITITDQKVEDKTKPTVTAVQTNNLITILIGL